MKLTKKIKKKHVLISAVVFAILAVAAAVYQRKAMVNFQEEIVESDSVASSGLKEGADTRANNSTAVRAVQMAIEGNVKELKGTIISQTDSILEVDAELIDFSKLSGLTEEELHENIESFPKTKKNIEVLVNNKTQIIPSRPDKALMGKIVIIDSDDLVYKNNRINASKVFVIASDSSIDKSSCQKNRDENTLNNDVRGFENTNTTQ